MAKDMYVRTQAKTHTLYSRKAACVIFSEIENSRNQANIFAIFLKRDSGSWVISLSKWISETMLLSLWGGA